jgi:excinuclease ABC subunit C
VELFGQGNFGMSETTSPQYVSQLPSKPGVYQFLNAQGEILYIGKAKNLRKRVTSYFGASKSGNYKQDVLVKKIAEVKYIIVENESDALLLENNLIKEYRPKYNILLKDDKTYPWICIRKERFPRVMQTRNYIADGCEYFGPYTSGMMVKTILELIRQLFKLRTCKLSLSESNVNKGKFKRCLEFHLGNCKGPCEGLQSAEDYEQAIAQIRDILKGNYHQVLNQMKGLMEQFAGQLQFEEAELVRKKIEVLERFRGRSTIVNPKIRHVDVFSMIDEAQFAYINFLKVVNGSIVQAHNLEIQKVVHEERKELLSSIIFDLRNRFKSKAPEIIVPFRPDIAMNGVRFTVPLRGDKIKLLELSYRNALSYRNDKDALRQSGNRTEQETILLEKLQTELRLKKLPVHIECFDNSNLQGTDPVASCVVYRSGRPDKSAYRHYNIKTVQGPDDYASMAEIIHRRYRRILEEKGGLPDLIIIDGGKGQLNAAIKSLKDLNIFTSVAVISIAKRLEEIYVPGDPVPLYLDKHSASLRLIQKIRDEAHRFGITFHQRKRSGKQLLSAFDQIPGIGIETRNKILLTEPDMEVLRKLGQEELIRLFGKRVGNVLFRYFSRT